MFSFTRDTWLTIGVTGVLVLMAGGTWTYALITLANILKGVKSVYRSWNDNARNCGDSWIYYCLANIYLHNKGVI